MYSILFSVPMLIAIVSASAFFIVLALHRRYTEDRLRKFTPAIVCFVLSANLTYLIMYGSDMILSDFLVLLAAVFIDIVSIVGFFSTLIFACILDYRDRRYNAGKGEKDNEEV